MNLALWRKAVSDAWLQLALSCLLLVLFSWVFVWLMSLFPLGAWGKLLNLLPGFVEPLVGIPLAKLASTAGKLSVLYVHVVTVLVCVGWAVGRGSNPISGEIGRGTMDLVVSLPVRRASILVPPAVVATLGAVALAFSVLGGTTIGTMTVTLEGNVALRSFLPGVINLICLTFLLTGITMFVSSLTRDRWRAIAVTVGFFVISIIVKMVGRLWPEDHWLDSRWFKYSSILTAFEPQRLILVPDKNQALWYDATLVGTGLICYLLAAVILTYRDIPAAR